MAGQRRAALAHLAEARGLAEEKEVRWFQAETLRLTGDVLLATGDAAAAEASYHEKIRFDLERPPRFVEDPDRREDMPIALRLVDVRLAQGAPRFERIIMKALGIPKLRQEPRPVVAAE